MLRDFVLRKVSLPVYFAMKNSHTLHFFTLWKKSLPRKFSVKKNFIPFDSLGENRFANEFSSLRFFLWLFDFHLDFLTFFGALDFFVDFSCKRCQWLFWVNCPPYTRPFEMDKRFVVYSDKLCLTTAPFRLLCFFFPIYGSIWRSMLEN